MGDQKKGWWPRARALVLPKVAWGLGLVPACRASASPSARQLDPCDPGNLAMPGQVLVAKERPVLPPMPTTPWVPLGTAGAQLSRGLSSACPSHMPSSPVPRKSPKASTSAGSLKSSSRGEKGGPGTRPPLSPAPITTKMAVPSACCSPSKRQSGCQGSLATSGHGHGHADSSSRQVGGALWTGQQPNSALQGPLVTFSFSTGPSSSLHPINLLVSFLSTSSLSLSLRLSLPLAFRVEGTACAKARGGPRTEHERPEETGPAEARIPRRGGPER